MTKISVLTKNAGIEFGMYHEAGVYFITDNIEAAKILTTAGCNLEEWDLITLEDAKKIKETYDRMSEYYKDIRE